MLDPQSTKRTYETMDGIAYLIDITCKMTARQKSHYRKLIMKMSRTREKARNDPRLIKEVALQMDANTRYNLETKKHELLSSKHQSIKYNSGKSCHCISQITNEQGRRYQ